jgi:hypothetical protein
MSGRSGLLQCGILDWSGRADNGGCEAKGFIPPPGYRRHPIEREDKAVVVARDCERQFAKGIRSKTSTDA